MRVSAAQFFAMSEAEREQVTHIDMDLDREAERRSKHWDHTLSKYGPCPRAYTYELNEPIAEPGTDWIEDKPL